MPNMTDIEPRRSGRKTKGQHTRNADLRELVPPTPPKPAPRRKQSVVKQPTPVPSSPEESVQSAGSEDEDDDDDDPNAQIRCACGVTKEIKGDSRMMVQCEGCKVWQHCECLELDEDELDNDKDKLYYCEICKPENHEEFLAKVERGEKPWETAKKTRRKKKGRKSTSGRGRARGRQTKKKVIKKQETEEEAKAESEEVETAQEQVPAAVQSPEREEEEEPPEVHDVVMGEAEDAAEEQKYTDNNKSELEKQKETILMDQVIQEAPNDIQNSEPPEQMKGQNALIEKEKPEAVKTEVSEESRQFEKTMLPPEAPPLHTAIPYQHTVKEDDEMPDAPRGNTPITPTTPTVSKQRDGKRKGSVAESTRSVRRKTTHDSDGDYKSDSDSAPSTKHRRISASNTTKEVPKEAKPSPRRVSLTKPPPKKPSGPDDLSVQSELVEKVDDLRNNARRNIVSFLAPIIQNVVEKNMEILSENQKVEGYSEKLALEIEHQLYMALWHQPTQPTQQYKLKARGIGLNLPKNPVLQSRLLKGEVTPEKLVQMKPEEMASEEFQLLAEQVRRESELQNTIIAEQTGPRIRRTHKGEEIVGDDIDHSTGNDEPVYSASRGTDHVMEDPPSAPRSRMVTPAMEDYRMSPQPMARTQSEEASQAAQPGSTPQTPKTPVATKTSSNRGRQFSIENVWNNINTPENDPSHQRMPGPRPPPPHMLSIRQHQPKLAIDADIDKLLAEEDHDMDNETPPYSPSELTFAEVPVPVWRGRISMVNVANFPARATFLGGPVDAQEKLPLGDLLGSMVLVDGRIAIDRATEYLCGQKFSNTNEIVVLNIEPEDHLEPHSQGEFSKLFQYFQKKERYGVIGKPANKAIKDCYLVPIDCRDDMPDFFETLPSHQLEPTPRKKRVFAVVFVLSKILLAEQQKSREASKASQSPMTQTTPVTPSVQNPAPTPTPLSAQSPQLFAAPQYHLSPQPQQQAYPQQPQEQYAYPGNHHNGYTYYQQQQQQPSQYSPSSASSNGGEKRFTFTPWKELQEALPGLTVEQVNIINQVVARNPHAQNDPDLLARLINEQGSNA